MISKFVSLTRTEAEPIHTTWDDFIAWLAKEPNGTFIGTLEHGGWSAAEFEPPLRAKENVLRVHGLVLDYDKGARWDVAVRLWSASDGLLYTTKSHSEGSARLRVVMPFARPVTVAEYDKLWAWAAARSQERECPVDGQCKDASRFWYDPTKPPGGWRAERFVGNTLDPDAILAHIERTRVAEPERPRLRVVSSADTNDILLKRARLYISKMPPAIQGEAGSVALFKVALALVQGLGLSDGDAQSIIESDYNPTCDPAWSPEEIRHKITDARKSEKVPAGYLLTDRVRISNTRTVRADATDGVQNSADAAEPVSKDSDTPVYPWEQWSGGRLLTKKRRVGDATIVYPTKDYHNVLVFVEYYPDYVGKWSMDERDEKIWLNGAEKSGRLVSELRSQIACCLNFTPTASDVEMAIHSVAYQNKFHPVRQYLQGLVWDRAPRLDSMASEYLGATEPGDAVLLRKFMVGAASRAMKPGEKLDTTLILYGGEGVLKSTFFDIMGGAWFRDTPVDFLDKDDTIKFHRSWIYELAELDHLLGRKDNSRIKAFLSSRNDTYRAPYGRDTLEHPRSFVICGTTNEKDFIVSDTGTRRYWVVAVTKNVPREALAAARDQLWAEAVCAWEDGEEWWLTAEQDAMRHERNMEYQKSDSWVDLAATWLAERVDGISIPELLVECFKVPTEHHDQSRQNRAAKAFKVNGWVRVRDRLPGKTGPGSLRWIYRRAVI